MTKFDNYDYDALSVEVWNDNYRLKNENTREETWNRVAKACASPENEENRKKVEEDFKKILYNDKFVPGGRILANIGSEDATKTSLFNCFVHHPRDIGLEDCDSIEGIYKLLTAQALTLRVEGGYGTNFSWMRPAGSYVKGIGSRTPGPLKFMELWDKSSEIVTTGSVKIIGERKIGEKVKIRKGAMMGVLNIWHPDIKDFITAKQTSGRFTKFNLSVGITEGFMNAVVNNLIWELKYPDTSIPEYKTVWNGFLDEWEAKNLPVIVYETIPAKDLWEMIMVSTYNRAEPGVLYLDTINKKNPLAYNENIAASNPCNLGSSFVLTKQGMKTFDDLLIGDVIWSQDEWVNVVNKVNTGIKPVYKYKTTVGSFLGTDNHNVISCGKSTQVKDAHFLDILVGPYDENVEYNKQDIVDGLVVGDGTCSSDKIYLCVGENDFSYFSGDFDEYITNEFKSEYMCKVKTTLTLDDVPRTYNRKIPKRFLEGNKNKVCSFLRGLYSANGSIVGGQRVSLKAASFDVIESVQIMLSSIGIRSYYTTNKSKSVKFKNGDYVCKQSYDLNITTDRDKFYKLIGFVQPYKMEKLKNIIETLGVSCKPNKVSYEIKDVEYLKDDTVYDITVDGEHHTYWNNGLNVHNCGEISMPTGVCNLGSISLPMLVKVIDGVLKFDFVEFQEIIKIAIRFLDNVNTVSTTPLPEYSDSVSDRRRVGLGIMGIGSLHIMLGIPFGSKESIELQEKIAKIKCEAELLASSELGKEKGSFKMFDSEKYFNSYYFKTLPIAEDVKKQLVCVGEMRNSHQSMNAPNGNTGVYARNMSGGIEPVFSVEGYFRWCIVPEIKQKELIDSGLKFPKVHSGEWFETEHFKFSKRADEQILKGSYDSKNYEVDKSRGLIVENFVEDYGVRFAKKFYGEKYKQMLDEKKFVCVADLSVKNHTDSLKTWAKYCNMSISKTVNLPNDYSFEDFKNVYMDAWKSEIKGITTYRDGTMTAVLETKESQKRNSEKSQSISYTDAPKRPEKLECDIHQVRIKGDSWTIFIGKLNGLPYEIFGGSEKYIKIPKVYTRGILQKDSKKNDMNSQYNLYYGEEGKETIIKDIVSVFENPLYNYHTRSLSMKLRHGIPVHFIVDMLQRDELGSELYSFNKVIARVLKTYIKDGTKKKGKCPNCGSEHLVMQEGCFVCQDCSYSKCS